MNVGRALSRTAVALGCCLWAAPVVAQTALGASTSASSNVLNHFSYDDKHHVSLQVYELNSTIMGRFIGADGTVLGTSFVVAPWVSGSAFAGAPKVAYSRGSSADVFMVIYVADKGANGLLGQLVQYTGQGPSAGGLVGGTIIVTKFASANQKPDDIVFNPVNNQFLAVWEELLGDGYEVIARAYNPDGTAVGSGAINVSNVSGSQGLSQVAYDWNRNRYFVSWQGEAFNNGPLGIFGKVLDGTGQPITQQIPIYAGAAFEPACIYLPERDGFLVPYTGFKPDRFVGARFVPSNYSGTLPDASFTALDTAGGDGYATGDYDWVSRKVFLGAMSDTSGRFIRGTVLDANGSPLVPPFVANSVPSAPNGAGLFYPTIRAAENGRFGLSYDVDYGKAAYERYEFTAAQTPGPHFGGGTVQPPQGGVIVSLDTPTVNATITPPFGVGGWSADTRSQVDNGIGTLHVWAIPTAGANGGQAVFVGSLNTDVDRSDVEALYGGLHKKSGFGVTMSNLPPGQYLLVFYPYSSVTNQFEYANVLTRVVNVNGSALTQIATPTWGQVFGAGGVGMQVTGYAVDLNSQSGTGIDAVHVWVVDAATNGTTFLGGATLGLANAQSAVFGANFANGGFSLTNGVAMTPGLKYVLVYSHSVGAGAFNLARIVGVFVQ